MNKASNNKTILHILYWRADSVMLGCGPPAQPISVFLVIAGLCRRISAISNSLSLGQCLSASWNKAVCATTVIRHRLILGSILTRVSNSELTISMPLCIIRKQRIISVYILEQNPKSGSICIQYMLLAVMISSVILLVNIIVMSSITSIFMLTLLHQIELEV